MCRRLAARGLARPVAVVGCVGCRRESLRKCHPAAALNAPSQPPPGRKERHARFELRFAEVTLKRPDKLGPEAPAELVVSAVDVREIAPVEAVPPVHWLIVTTFRIDNMMKAAETVDLYRGRFLIERLFRMLKTGQLLAHAFEADDSRCSWRSRASSNAKPKNRKTRTRQMTSPSPLGSWQDSEGGTATMANQDPKPCATALNAIMPSNSEQRSQEIFESDRSGVWAGMACGRVGGAIGLWGNFRSS
jgi:hypothetical protein